MIKLKTTQQMIRDESTINIGNFAHDALVAHAYQEAIKEAGRNRFYREWIEDRVAELLKKWGVE